MSNSVIAEPITVDNHHSDPSLSNSRDAILEAALKEFSEFGYDGASLRNIGRRANVDFTLITYYFKTKEKLWITVATRGMEIYGKIMRDKVDTPKNRSATEKLKSKLRGELEFAYSNNSLFKFISFEFQSVSKRRQWLIDNFISQTRKITIDLIGKAQEEGGLIPGEPSLLTSMMQTSIRGLLVDVTSAFNTSDNSEDKHALIEEYWSLFERIYFPAPSV